MKEYLVAVVGSMRLCDLPLDVLQVLVFKIIVCVFKALSVSKQIRNLKSQTHSLLCLEQSEYADQGAPGHMAGLRTLHADPGACSRVTFGQIPGGRFLFFGFEVLGSGAGKLVV